MKILHFYKTYFPDSYGGIEQVIFQLARGAVQRGLEVEVLSLSGDASEKTLMVDNHLAHRARMDFQIASTGFSLSSIRRFAALAGEADIVHYHFPWPFMDLAHFATRLKKPTVVTYHSDILRQKLLLKAYRPLMHRFLGSMDRIVATSPNYLSTSAVLDRYRDKTAVIPIGLDKSSYPVPAPDLVAAWRARIRERFFLFVGMIRYYKGLHILLDAVQGTGYPIVIVGSGPVEDELKKHAQRLQLKNIHFLGTVNDEDKAALLTLCYAVAFPSHLRSEAFGVSLLEGAMYGKPMISSEIGTGTSYVNVDGETGLVVPRSDPLAFRDAMRFLWDHPAVAAGMGQRAQQRYWKIFTAERMAAGYIDLYQELLAAKTPASGRRPGWTAVPE
ncbi:MAG: glycosyltransferase family 4 protein [Pseudomonadota bacterium]